MLLLLLACVSPTTDTTDVVEASPCPDPWSAETGSDWGTVVSTSADWAELSLDVAGQLCLLSTEGRLVCIYASEVTEVSSAAVSIDTDCFLDDEGIPWCYAPYDGIPWARVATEAAVEATSTSLYQCVVPASTEVPECGFNYGYVSSMGEPPPLDQPIHDLDVNGGGAGGYGDPYVALVCGLTDAGLVLCSDPFEGVAQPSGQVGPYAALSLGGAHIATLTEGGVLGFLLEPWYEASGGFSASDPLSGVDPALTWRQVVASSFMLGLTSEGALVVWPATPTVATYQSMFTDPPMSFLDMPPAGTFTRIASTYVSEPTMCALRDDGRVVCWGDIHNLNGLCAL